MRSFLMVALLVIGSVAEAGPLKVEVTPKTTTWKPKQKVTVALKVTNTAKTKTTIKVWLCSWNDNWKSNDPELTYDVWGCDKNYLADVKLDPGASKAWSLEMYATEKARLGAHELSLTFASDGGTPIASNKVAITVAK